MTDQITLSFAAIEALSTRALTASRVSPANAAEVAHSIACAERDGQKIVGLSYLPYYCDQAACGKVDGFAVPVVTTPAPSVVRVDARTGFAHPAIALGLPALSQAVARQGVAVMAVGQSYACGSLGYFVEEIAAGGHVALMTANASPSIAIHGSKTPFFGTNPIAFATPRAGRPPMVIDQSSSVVAKVAVIEAQRRSERLPPGWALDADGVPTQDPDAAMAGTLLPIGGYKGSALALMVDILSSGFTGSHFSFEASSFGDCEGGPPRTGQFILAIDPDAFGGADFTARIETLFEAMLAQPGVRLPGDRRIGARAAQEHGIVVDAAIVATLESYAANGSPMAPKSS